MKKKTAPQSAAADGGEGQERDHPSSGSEEEEEEEEKQLSQRRQETEETSSAAAGARIMSEEEEEEQEEEEEGTSTTTAESLARVQSAAAREEECRRRRSGQRDGDKHGKTARTNEEVVTGVAECLPSSSRDSLDDLLSLTSLTRKSTAAFTSCGSSCRVVGSVTGVGAGILGGGGANSSGDEEAAAEGRLQQMLNCIAKADGLETVVTRAVTTTPQQQQKPKDDTNTVAAALEQRSLEVIMKDTGWKANAPTNGAGEGETERFFREPEDGAKGCSVTHTSEQCIHEDDAAANQVQNDILLREQQNVDATPRNLIHEGATTRAAHSNSSVASPFTTAHQAPAPVPLHREGSSSISRTERASILPERGVRGLTTGKECVVESCDFQQETGEGGGEEATEENETEEEKTAFLADIWQFKRSASDGPSASLGIWRSDDDFRGTRSTEVPELESARVVEETSLNAQQLLDKTLYRKEYTESSCRSTAGACIEALDCAEKRKWDLKLPRSSSGSQHAVPQWDASSFRQPRKIFEAPERRDPNIIRSLSSLSRGLSAARERRGKFDGEEANGRRGSRHNNTVVVAGGCFYRDENNTTALLLGTESPIPAHGRKSGTTAAAHGGGGGQSALTFGGHERRSRRASSPLVVAERGGFEPLPFVGNPGRKGDNVLYGASKWLLQQQQDHLSGDDGGGDNQSKDGSGVQRRNTINTVGTPTPGGSVRRGEPKDDDDDDTHHHLAKPARAYYVSSLSFPLDQQSCPKAAAHGKQTHSREFFHGRPGEIVETYNQNTTTTTTTTSSRYAGRTLENRNRNNNGRASWDATETASRSRSPTFFAGPSVIEEEEARNIVSPWTGTAESVGPDAPSLLPNAITWPEDGVVPRERKEEEGASVITRKRGGAAAVEKTHGERLVRELVEEFDKRRTNFSILVPKVLELVAVLMGQPGGTQLPCVLPRNFYPAAALLRPAPLPVCATFSEVGQTSTIETLERYFPSFNVEGGLLLCTQGRRLESGGGGKYYFQDSRGHVVGCHKKHLARYDAQGRVASPVLLKTLLFCLVLKQVSRSKHGGRELIEEEEEEVFRLPASAATSAAVCHSVGSPAPQMISSCDCGRSVVSGDQDAGYDGEIAELPVWKENNNTSPPLGSPRLLRSLLDPLPPADALLAEVQQSSSAERDCLSTGVFPAEFGERPNEIGSTSTRASNSSGTTTVIEEFETLTMKRKTAGCENTDDKGRLPSPSSLQGSKLTRRSESCIGISQWSQNGENSNDPSHSASGRLRRAVSSSLSVFANKQQQQPSTTTGGTQHGSTNTTTTTGASAPPLGGSPTSKREAELWGECISELRSSTRENKQQLRNLPKERATINNGDGLVVCPREKTDGVRRPTLDDGNSADGENRIQHHGGETELCLEDEGEISNSAGTEESPAISAAASPGSLKSSMMQKSPWWGEKEKNSARTAKPGVLSVVRSSNPQRLVRVYRSLVVEDKTHVVERLLRVWSMTLHVRLPQSPRPSADGDDDGDNNGVSRTSLSSVSRGKTTEKSPFLLRKNMEAGVSTRRQRGLNDEERDEKCVSVSERRQEERGAMQIEEEEIGRTANDMRDNTSGTRCRQGGQDGGGSSSNVLGNTSDGNTTKSASQLLRDGERRKAGTQAPETFPLRKANTTDCGRFLRSMRAAEKSIEGLIIERGDGRGTQNADDDGGPGDSANRRRITTRLRRASTSARRDLSLEQQHQQLPRCGGGRRDETAAQEHYFVGNMGKYGRATSPSSHSFFRQQQPVMCKRRNDAGQRASSSSHIELAAETMGGDTDAAFLWRPCMSILWVKPLTVEQTMLKWSKSTPVYESVEEMDGERRDITSLHAAAAVRHRRDRSPIKSPLLPMTLRSAQNHDELFSTPTSTTKASHNDKHNGKKIGLLSSCSPDSVRSELSTSADCCTTSSLPPSPLFARASAVVGLTQVDQQQQQPRPLQQAIRLPRLHPSSLPVLDQSPTSIELLQAIQQHLLQLVQRGDADQAAPGRGALHPTQQTSTKGDKSSNGGTDLHSGSNTNSHSTEAAATPPSPTNRQEALIDAQPRRANTWTAPDSNGSSKKRGEESADSPMPGNYTPQKNGGCGVRSLLQVTEAAAGESSDIPRTAATSELHQSSIDSSELCSVVLHRAGQERGGDLLQPMAPAISGGSGLCPFVVLDPLTNQSPHSRGTQLLEQCNRTSDEENGGGETAAQSEGQITSSLGARKPDSGQLHLLYDSSIEDPLLRAAALPDGGEREYEGGRRHGEKLTETEKMCGGAVEKGVSRDTPLHRSPGPHRRCKSPPLLEQAAGLLEATGPVTDPVFTSGTRGNVPFQSSAGPSESGVGGDLDSLNLISRLLGLTVGNNHTDGGKGQTTTRTTGLRNGAKSTTASAAETVHGALEALLSLHGDLSSPGDPGNTLLEAELSPPAAPSGCPPAAQEDHTVVTLDHGTDHARHCGQGSRKRGLDAGEEAHKQEERGPEGRKKVAAVPGSSAATADIMGERTREGTACCEFVPQDCNNKKVSPPTHRQKKKTKWSALTPDEISREDSEITKEPVLVDHEKPPETSVHYYSSDHRPTAGTAAAPTAGLEDDASTNNNEERRLTWDAALEQCNVHQGLVDLFTKVLQQSVSATDDDTTKGGNE